MSSRAFPWKMVLVGGAVALLVAAIGGYQYVIRSFIQTYYLSEYRPEALTAAELGQPPATHRLTDVPWLSETPALCQSISLRMLAAQQGRLEPRSTIDFLMGFTWGATAIPRRTGFFPGQDPEVGFLRAAPYLGFTRRYLTTDSADDFVRALKTFLSKGRAVRLAVDRSLLLEARGVVPHSVVLIGYDAEGFEYYEPTCEDAKRCAAMERAPGQAGLKVTTAQLLLATESQALVFQYPWKYQLLVLEPSSAPVPELSALLAVNGRALMGMKSAGPSTGSVAVTDTANAIERHGKDVVTPELLRGVKIAALVRRDDSIALSSLFAARPELAPAAEALDEAGKAYARAVTAFEANEPEQGAQALKEAAAFDLEAGKAMLRAGADGG
ncbi:MAG: hypothetical protein Q8S33_34000 [Myxococcales bacterium]|nr:hypothetical protein [Myxococcales bacterium]